MCACEWSCGVSVDVCSVVLWCEWGMCACEWSCGVSGGCVLVSGLVV